jgi:hypothetical protein
MKRSKLRKSSISPVAKCKERIQYLCREIALKRDRTCFLANYSGAGACGGYRKDGGLILQFDHLNSRARNISYGMPELGVLVCQRHHIFWKPQYPAQYEAFARDFIGEKRCILLDRVRADRKTYTFTLVDWLHIELALQQELDILNEAEADDVEIEMCA